MNKALVLLSGGLDSSTLVFHLLSKGYSVQGFFVDYGQTMALAEKRAAQHVSSAAKIDLKCVNAPLDDSLRSGCLFDDHPSNWTSNFISFLPQRNLFLLTLASMYAQNNNIKDIYIGVITIDGEPFPDTTKVFLDTAQKALQLSYPLLHIKYPFLKMSKTAVASLAIHLKVPVDATYSCEMSTDHHCMQCPSCIDRYWALNNNR